MQAFMDQDFLLTTPTAKKLYHEVAATCPILDYHCHINPREIFEDRRYQNITQVWLGGDHYKWRLMRCAGVPERYITGDAPDREKFQKWAEVLSKAIGNPLYHWSHLELQRYFGYQGLLNGNTAETVWNLANAKLQSEGFSVRGLIEQSNVALVCTTDDPLDSLEWHQKIAADASFHTTVLPAWRPDKAMNLEKPAYLDYLAQLAGVCGAPIRSFHDLKAALVKRMAYFHENRCRLSDHALSYAMFAPAADAEVERIFTDRLAGKAIGKQDELAFKTAFLLFVAGEYRRLGWTMQLHVGCRRDNNTAMFERLGPDTGYDCIDNHTPSAQLAELLGALDAAGSLPKTVLYSLNPQDNAAIDTVCGCFQNDEAVSRLQHGSAWWFNDHLEGMTNQLVSLANLGYLAGFVGMLTDSRSFLSYPRHEYFRRILCRLIGQWVEEGQYPDDFDTLAEIVRGVSYENAKQYFAFPG
ncbi:MAG TPA: glucuronate isomerase [Candidatus Limiplasma sp.]|nr:glucuronate isomerase [Candidatus Limiplasma sp.]HPS80481.1 glucuronate isomerase [Candidatus Limiplasma sp.]